MNSRLRRWMLYVTIGASVALIGLVAFLFVSGLDPFSSMTGLVLTGAALFLLSCVLLGIFHLFTADTAEPTILSDTVRMTPSAAPPPAAPPAATPPAANNAPVPSGGPPQTAPNAAASTHTPQPTAPYETAAPTAPPQNTAVPSQNGAGEQTSVQSDALFSELYMNSPVPYILVTRDGRITSMNMAAVRLFSITSGEMDGKNVFDHIEGDTPDKVPLFVSKLQEGLFVNDEEASVTRKDGTKRWVMLSLFPFVDEQGHKAGLLTLVDITKQKEIDKAKSEFVSLASHQLKTPITIIKWNTELLDMEKEGLTERQKNYVAKARAGVARMETIIEDFLNVSRLELGTLRMHPTMTSLAEFLEQAITEYGMRAEDTNVRIVREFSDQVPDVEIDPNFFRMAVGNLISNAVKYTPAGGTVTITTKTDGNNFTISVADTGIGVPKDEQDKLFSKVFRASNAKQFKSEGTGLGLYVVKEVVEALGGSISFVSEEGKGTTFTITMPLYQSSRPKSSAPHDASPVAA